MVLVLPQITEAPEIANYEKMNDLMKNNNSLIITKWEEDSENHVKLSTFIPFKETSNTEKIMNDCYMKGKIINV